LQRHDIRLGDYYSTIRTADDRAGISRHIQCHSLGSESIVIFLLSLGFGSFLSGPLWIIAVIHAVYLVHKGRSEEKMREIARETLRD
jgi:hypothetical protein